MGRDSNPRDACASAGFQDRCLQPLGHPSSRSFQGQHFANCNRIATGCSYFQYAFDGLNGCFVGASD
jgi:hypothetical protein